MVQSTCQPLQCLYRGFGARLSVTKDTLLVVSPQVVATFCKLTSCGVFDHPIPRAKARILADLLAPLKPRPSRSHSVNQQSQIVKSAGDAVHLSFRHVATEKSIAVTCYTGSVSGATSSMLPCCSRNTRWQRRANAKLWVAMREVN